MTLFKKVFGNHNAVEMDDPAPADPQDDAAITEGQDEDFTTDLSLISGVDTFELPGPEENEDHAAQVMPSPERDEPVEDRLAACSPPPATQAPPPEPEPAPKLSMAERAAAAQRQIELSKQRFAAEQAQVPPPAEHKADDTPAPVAAMPAKTPSAPADEITAPPTAATPQRPGRSAKRTRTRLLGFSQDADATPDPFAKAATDTQKPAQTFPVGWFVVVDGPGMGHSLTLFDGVSTIGRGNDQAIKLDFGDTSISRQHHAAVAYDAEQQKFYLGHGGKSNIIRLNDRPVLSTEELSHSDTVRIGETTLRFVALCGGDFNWGTGGHEDE